MYNRLIFPTKSLRRKTFIILNYFVTKFHHISLFKLNQDESDKKIGISVLNTDSRYSCLRIMKKEYPGEKQPNKQHTMYS